MSSSYVCVTFRYRSLVLFSLLWDLIKCVTPAGALNAEVDRKDVATSALQADFYPLPAGPPGGRSSVDIRANHAVATQLRDLFPDVMEVVGPFPILDYGGDVLGAYGGIWDVFSERVKEPQRVQSISYPSEVAPEGKATWATINMSDVSNFSSILKASGRSIFGRKMWEEVGSKGWAVGNFTLVANATVLMQCSHPFLVDFDDVRHLQDVHGEKRAISVFHLRGGVHYIALDFDFSQDVSCKIYEDVKGNDSSFVRQLFTGVKDGSDSTNTLSPLLLLPDAYISDIVDGAFASPYLTVPVMNLGIGNIEIVEAALIDAPEGLSLRPLGNRAATVASGQQQPLRLELAKLADNISLACGAGKILNLTLRLVPRYFSGEYLTAQTRDLTSNCFGSLSEAYGFVVTFPDFDGSIQRTWVSPPNLSNAKNHTCPLGGCPTLLSLHGASVEVDALGPRTFMYSNFPYAAWLVMPTNRWHWGTDWEEQGLDNALAAMQYVRENLPGIRFGAALQRYLCHPNRVVLHGHSMGGHGCYVMGTHFPDGVMGMACAAGWSSMGQTPSKLLDGSRDGLLRTHSSEHAADLLAGNLLGIPFVLTYGDSDDNVPPSEPRYMARLVDTLSQTSPVAVKAKGEKPLIREEAHTGHWFGQNTPALDAFFRHLLHGEGPPHEATQKAMKFADWVDAKGALKFALEKYNDTRRVKENMEMKLRKTEIAGDFTSLTKPEATNLVFVGDGQKSPQRLMRREKDLFSKASSLPTSNAKRRKALNMRNVVPSLLEHEHWETSQLGGSVAVDATRISVTAYSDGDSDLRARLHQEAADAAVEKFRSTTVPAPEERQLPEMPDYVEFQVTNTATFGSRGNLQILQLVAPNIPGKLLVGTGGKLAGPPPNYTSGSQHSVLPGNTWYIRTYNVRRFRLNNPWISGVLMPQALVIDGVPFSVDQLGGSSLPVGSHFCGARAAKEDGAPRWHICNNNSWASLQHGSSRQGGPISMVIRRAPVCIVHYGATDNLDRLAINLANRMYFISRYMPTVINSKLADPTWKNLTAEVIACLNSSNLILFGHATKNAWMREMSCTVPYVQQMQDGRFRLSGEVYSAPETALVALGGDARAQRRVLLVAGTDSKGLAKAVRLLPVSTNQGANTDFFVFGERSGWLGAGGILAAGFVDQYWQVSSGSFIEPEPLDSQNATYSWGVGPSDSQRVGGDCSSQREELLASDEELLTVPASEYNYSLWVPAPGVAS